MTKYILHGRFTKEKNSLNKSFFREFCKDLPKKATILQVYFAQEAKDYEWKIIEK